MLILYFVGAIVSLGASFVIFAYAAARANLHATHIETGGFKFVVRGESLHKVIDELKGYYVDQKTHRVLPDEDLSGTPRRIGIMEKIFGIVWVSWFWPVRRIHRFQVVADKLLTEKEIEEKHLPVRRQLHQEIRDEDYFRFMFPHPVMVTDVELAGDRWKVDMIVMLNLRVVNPVIVVFTYKGKVLQQVDAAVKAAVIDFCNKPDFTYQKFIEEKKGSTSDFAKIILTLNKSTSPETKEDGLRTAFGIEITAAWIETADLSPSQEALDNAARAFAEEKLRADAKVEQARGEKALAKGEREGIGEGFKAMMDSLILTGISPERAARIVREEVRTGNIAKAGLGTYVEGGGNIVPTVDAGHKEKTT